MKILTLKSLKKEIDEIKNKIKKEKAIVILNKNREEKAIEDLKKLGWEETMNNNYYHTTFTILEKEF